MSDLEIAISYLLRNDYGQALENDGAVLRIMHHEFRQHLEDNESVLNDYDMLELCDRFGVDMALREQCIAPTCGGQCLAGASEKLQEEAIGQLRQHGDHAMADLMEYCKGGIYYYPAALLRIAQEICGNGGITEILVRRLVRFVIGHERRHSVQILSFLQEGRTEEFQHMLLDDEDTDVSIAMAYSLIPSEMDADEAGLRFVKECEAGE